jgi:flagellar hook-associated protein 3 FlgL
MTNSQSAQGALELQESILATVTSLLQDARVLAVNAGNPALNDADRASLATDLQGRYAQLLGLANSTDGNGQYLFSGYKGSTQPFAENAPGNVIYYGDQGQRLVQISASRQVAASSSGAEVFQLIKNGNGTFVTAADKLNAGTGIVSPGTLLDPAAWAASNQNFTISFTSATTYNVIDNESALPVVTDATYTSGTAISFAGVQLEITGGPVSGDSFTLQASSTQQDIFSTISALIAALNTPSKGNVAGNAKLTNELNTALSNLDLALDNVLTVRASVGATLREVEAQRNIGEDLGLQYSATLSELQDLDYAKAISDLTLRQVNLEAAQKSFLRVQGLSLFNYL